MYKASVYFLYALVSPTKHMLYAQSKDRLEMAQITWNKTALLLLTDSWHSFLDEEKNITECFICIQYQFSPSSSDLLVAMATLVLIRELISAVLSMLTVLSKNWSCYCCIKAIISLTAFTVCGLLMRESVCTLNLLITVWRIWWIVDGSYQRAMIWGHIKRGYLWWHFV